MDRRLDKTVFRDNLFTMFDDSDRTKKLRFQLSGITTGTARTLTIPDASGTICLLGSSPTFGDITAYAASGNVHIYVQTASAGIATLGLWGHKLGADAAFGSIPFFNNEDSVAQILSYRTGADDAGDLRFQTQATGGALTTRLTISSAGNFDFAAGNINTTGTGTFGAGGVRLEDGSGDHLSLVSTAVLGGSDLTITIDPDDSHRTLKLSGSPTLDDWFDQSVKTTASPTFAGETISTTGEINFRDSDISIGSTLMDGVLDMSADNAIYMFYDNADVGDAVDGQSFYIYRRAGERDDYFRFWVDNASNSSIDVSNRLYIYRAGALRAYLSGTVFRFYTDIRFANDVYKMFWGAGDDSTIHYDGTNMIINPKVVGSGYLQVAGAIASGQITITASSDTTDVSGINTLFINPAGTVVIGGFVGGVAGQVLFVSAIANGQDITLEHVEGIGGATQDVYLHSGLDETLSTEFGGWTLTCDGTNWYDTSHSKHV